MPTLRGTVDGSRIQVAIVVSRFNEPVTSRMLSAAEACFEEHGCGSDRRTVIHVPGAWEIPQAAKLVAEAGRVQAIVGLGALIRGQTPHFEFLAEQVARGLSDIGLTSGIPTIFGVLTTENAEQAIERADPGRRNKGREAALAALEMASLFSELRRSPGIE